MRSARTATVDSGFNQRCNLVRNGLTRTLRDMLATAKEAQEGGDDITNTRSFALGGTSWTLRLGTNARRTYGITVTDIGRIHGFEEIVADVLRKAGWTDITADRVQTRAIRNNLK